MEELVEVVRFRVGADEKENIEAEAKKLGMSVSAFIRLLIKQWSIQIKLEKVGATRDEKS